MSSTTSVHAPPDRTRSDGPAAAGAPSHGRATCGGASDDALSALLTRLGSMPRAALVAELARIHAERRAGEAVAGNPKRPDHAALSEALKGRSATRAEVRRRPARVREIAVPRRADGSAQGEANFRNIGSVRRTFRLAGPEGLRAEPATFALAPGRERRVRVGVSNADRRADWTVEVHDERGLDAVCWVVVAAQASTRTDGGSASGGRVARVDIGLGEADLVPLLEALHSLVLLNPEGAQAMFSALAPEGRRFATTEQGQRWRARLVASPLVGRASLAWEAASLRLLDADPAGDTPSALLDALFMAAARPDAELLLDSLFRRGIGDGRPSGAGA